MNPLNIFAAIGRLIASIFKGRTGRIVEQIALIVEAIVRELMGRVDLTGAQKFKLARAMIIERAAEEGLEYADHAINLAIEWEVTKARGDPIEQILDEGLELARAIVKKVSAGDLAGDEERRDRAVYLLKTRLLREGKNWLTSAHTLNLLVEAAVAGYKN